VRAVFKEHNEAEGEKGEENEPEKPANERHRRKVEQPLCPVNGLANRPCYAERSDH
jgi:hypothetical protein